ncbi:hypothetical protein GCM10023116_42960 [Kistimonas scapharcae]|uniref:Uncharacterized protein n=1 Tax=Kistimonas scapharcae TaxID=1036133 RepID=A0ABP8V879_9GAMM
MMIIEKLLTPIRHLHGSYVAQKKSDPVVDGRTLLGDLSSEQLEILTNNCLQENLTNLYRTLDTRRVAILGEIIEDDAAKEYWECFQDFADTLYATIVQLEEYGYEITDNHPIRGLNQYFQTECARVREELYGIEKEGKYRTTPEARIMQLKLEAIPELLKNTNIRPDSTIDFTDIPKIGFEKTNTALEHQLNQLSGLEEAGHYDDNYEDFGLTITRPILTNAHNLVRAYELETQQSLDISHPLKRLASFSHATDDQLSEWIASGDQNFHPVYAAINNFYYDREIKKLVQFSEDHLLEDETGSLFSTSQMRHTYDEAEDDDMWPTDYDTRVPWRETPGLTIRELHSSDDEDEPHSPVMKRRRHSVDSTTRLKTYRSADSLLSSVDRAPLPHIKDGEE